jgi:hypothetical protein
MQEGVESDNTEKLIVHEALGRFIVTSHAFHNDLLAPIPLF